MDKKQISINLDLELAKKNLNTARDEVAAMGGNQSSTVHLTTGTFPCFFSHFEPSDFTRTDVRSENRQLQARLKNVVSLEKMKQTLEKKDLDLAAAQMETREKIALADKKLASVGKLEEEIAQLKKDKEILTNEVGSLKAKKGELESYLGQLAAKLVLKLEGISSCSTDL